MTEEQTTQQMLMELIKAVFFFNLTFYSFLVDVSL